MNLWEAWAHWTAGELGHDQLVWGVPVLWLGRAGKLLQVVAGATIVADIIGAPRLRAFGRSLHDRFNVTVLRQRITDVIDWRRAWMQYLLAPAGSAEEKEAEARAGKYRLGVMNLMGAAVAGLLAGLLIKTNLFVRIISGITVMGIVGAYVSPYLLIVSVGMWMVIGLILDTLIIEPVAWLLERESLERLTKIFSLVLLLIGFHFDMLAS